MRWGKGSLGCRRLEGWLPPNLGLLRTQIHLRSLQWQIIAPNYTPASALRLFFFSSLGYAGFDVRSLGSVQSKEVERTFAPSLHPVLGNGLLSWGHANRRDSVSCSCLGSHLLGVNCLSCFALGKVMQPKLSCVWRLGEWWCL